MGRNLNAQRGGSDDDTALLQRRRYREAENNDVWSDGSATSMGTSNAAGNLASRSVCQMEEIKEGLDDERAI